VLGVAAFVAFWVVVGFGLFYLAIRGGPSNVRAGVRRPSRGANRIVGVMFTFVALGFGIALPLALLTGNHSHANAQIGGVKLTAAERDGRILFGEHCGVCHTLAAANAVGKVGPNLDMLKPSASVVEHTIAYGCLPNASSKSDEACLGQGVMPAQVVTGVEATDVAKFVAKVAGNE
jgi:mono/diheme cytochrome c family protein